MQSVVIVGAGQAGGWAARTLRDQKFAGRITLVAEERHPPYERPPLSKEVLLGTRSPESTYLWTLAKLEELDIDVMLGCHAVSLTRRHKTVMLSNGKALDTTVSCSPPEAGSGNLSHRATPATHSLFARD